MMILTGRERSIVFALTCNNLEPVALPLNSPAGWSTAFEGWNAFLSDAPAKESMRFRPVSKVVLDARTEEPIAGVTFVRAEEATVADRLGNRVRDIPECHGRYAPVAKPATSRFRPSESAFLLVGGIDLLECEWHAVVAQVESPGRHAIIDFRDHVFDPPGA
ncbi:hypothetical protein PQR11_20070 [Paraburkholderia strydomiana]